MPEREITFAEAVREALAEEMRRDPNVFIMGEDVAEAGRITSYNVCYTKLLRKNPFSSFSNFYWFSCGVFGVDCPSILR